jgi:uncharacterized protein
VTDDALTDPDPVTGPHPGGPRREDPPFPAVADAVADRTVLGTAALVHDVHRVEDVDPRESLDSVERLLADVPVGDDAVAAVRDLVAGHDDYAFRGEAPDPPSVEAAVVWDADNLDAVGAVGVARTFAFGGANGSPLWDPDGEAYSQLYHLEDKLLKLRAELHTAPAREVAADRHTFLERFHERFRAEWAGDR